MSVVCCRCCVFNKHFSLLHVSSVLSLLCSLTYVFRVLLLRSVLWLLPSCQEVSPACKSLHQSQPAYHLPYPLAGVHGASWPPLRSQSAHSRACSTEPPRRRYLTPCQWYWHCTKRPLNGRCCDSQRSAYTQISLHTSTHGNCCYVFKYCCYGNKHDNKETVVARTTKAWRDWIWTLLSRAFLNASVPWRFVGWL